MRARAVAGLAAQQSLRKAAERIIRTRLQELLELAPLALAGGEARALHDLRIAAKRMRYILELTGFCFGGDAEAAAASARAIQDLAGAIHDYDLLLERIAAHATDFTRERGQALAVEVQGEVPPAAERADLATCAALGSLAIECQAQRALLLAQLRTRFDEDQRSALQRTLLAALRTRQRPARQGA